MINDKFKILIIGYGSIGQRHYKTFKSLLEISEIAVLPSRLPPKENNYPNNTSLLSSLSDAFSFNADGVIIASPATSHCELAAQFLDHNKSIFIEKPLGTDIEKAKRLYEISESKINCNILIGYNLTYLNSLRELKRKIELNEHGKTLAVKIEVGQYLPSWRSKNYTDSVSANKFLGGGAVNELSHEIYLIYDLFGMPSLVSAHCYRLSSLNIDVEDFADIHLYYKEIGVAVSITLDFIQHKQTRNCKVIGSEGNLVWDGFENTISSYRFDAQEKSKVMKSYGNEDTYKKQAIHFIRCMQNKEKPRIDIFAGLDVMKIIDAIKISSESGRTIEF